MDEQTTQEALTFDTLQLHECSISRRGKAAKGTVTLKTFGVPVLDEKGVAKDWNYTPYLGMDETDVFLQAKEMMAKYNAIVAVLSGYDEQAKSDALQSQNQHNLYLAFIWREKLAQDDAEADALAKAWHQAISGAAKGGADSEVQAMIHGKLVDARRKVIDGLKRKGLWKDPAMMPRLVDNRAESDDDSDDTEQ